MDKSSRALILDECLERLRAGKTRAACLARYGEQAAELSPLLAAAAQAQRVAGFSLSDSQRQQAKARLRAAMVDQARRNRGGVRFTFWLGWLALLRPARGLALAGVLAAVLFVTMTVTAVAASRPGDVAYPLRVVVERAPVLLQTTPAGRANQELRTADRRLADLQGYMASTGQISPAAIGAILVGDEAAALRAEALPESSRAEIAERLAAHARMLSSLASTAHEPAAAPALAEAAARVTTLATLLGPTPAAPGVLPGPTPSAAAPLLPPATRTSVVPTATPTPTQAPRLPDTPTHAPPSPAEERPPSHGPATTPAASPTLRPVQPGQRATILAQTATARPPSATALRATAVAPTASAVPATPVPGRRATALAETATPPPAQQPAVTHTPRPPAGDPTTPVPGRRATALAQTATVPTSSLVPEPTAERGPGEDAPARPH